MKRASLAALVLTLSTSLVVPVLRAEDAPASQPAAKEPVAYAKLKAALPQTFLGLKRTNASGSKSSIGTMKISQAEGTYGEGEKNANITIIDYGAMPGMMDGLTAWSKIEIDNDSDTESTKTTKVGTYPAMETFRKESKDADITVAVGGRFLVSVKSTGAALEDVRKELAKLDLKAVEDAAK